MHWSKHCLPSTIDLLGLLFPASCVLQITYTATYPDEIPVIEITSFDGIDEEHIDTLLEFIKEQVCVPNVHWWFMEQE